MIKSGTFKITKLSDNTIEFSGISENNQIISVTKHINELLENEDETISDIINLLMGFCVSSNGRVVLNHQCGKLLIKIEIKKFIENELKHK